MRRILVLDDSVTIQKVMKYMFSSSQGFELKFAKDVDEAQAALSETTPDAIIAHIRFAGKQDPAAFFGGLRQACPRILVLKDSFDSTDALQQAGFAHFLQKPFLFEVLLQKLDEVMGDGGLASGDAARVSPAQSPGQNLSESPFARTVMPPPPPPLRSMAGQERQGNPALRRAVSMPSPYPVSQAPLALHLAAANVAPTEAAPYQETTFAPSSLPPISLQPRRDEWEAVARPIELSSNSGPGIEGESMPALTLSLGIAPPPLPAHSSAPSGWTQPPTSLSRENDKEWGELRPEPEFAPAQNAAPLRAPPPPPLPKATSAAPVASMTPSASMAPATPQRETNPFQAPPPPPMRPPNPYAPASAKAGPSPVPISDPGDIPFEIEDVVLNPVPTRRGNASEAPARSTPQARVPAENLEEIIERAQQRIRLELLRELREGFRLELGEIAEDVLRRALRDDMRASRVELRDTMVEQFKVEMMRELRQWLRQEAQTLSKDVIREEIQRLLENIGR